MLETEILPNAFDQHPQFYQQDNRRLRGFNPVSREFLEIKYRVLLPPAMIKDKHILDLGSCLGAAGQWALHHGAARYTGVEVQSGYAEESRRLLAHWGDRAEVLCQDIRSFLQQVQAQSYDIVVIAGMLYHFIDTKNIIDLACYATRQWIVVETNFPPGVRNGSLPRDAVLTEYVTDQEVNLADKEASLLGISATSSLPALDIFFGLNGFFKNEEKLKFPITSHSIIYDESMLGHSDLQIRFAARYLRSEGATLRTLENNLPHLVGEQRQWQTDQVAQQRSQQYQERVRELQTATSGSWRFAGTVAEQFDTIARREIPDYQRTIDLCVHIAQRMDRPDIKIIDVGSALGATLAAFHNAGFRNLYGVDNSQEMLDRSFSEATLILSDHFPMQYAPFDLVCANWVLHFIADRIGYLQAIYQAMAKGGYLVLTEKLTTSDFVHELYYDFKRANGMSEEQIRQKREQISGVLTTQKLQWYLTTLETLGYAPVDIINANTAFVTFLAQKP